MTADSSLAPLEGSSRAGIVALLASFGAAAACVAISWLHPALEAYRPWSPGDPLPVLAALMPQAAPRVVEDISGAPELAVVPEPDATPPALVASIGLAANLPAHPPGVPTALEDPGDRGMEAYYRALHEVEAGRGMARASHWGDSTIAADGITGTVRARLQARFGNGGPGFLSAGMDPQWSTRPDVGFGKKGEWTTVTLLKGGGNGRYGLGGIVSTAAPDASASFSSPKLADGTRLPLQHFEVWYQVGPGTAAAVAAPGEGAAAEEGAAAVPAPAMAPGGWWASLDGRGVGSGSAAAASAGDRYFTTDVATGYTRASIGATAAGTATFYGVVMETAGPGVVWDALGVTGVGTHSFNWHGQRHLSAQVARRRPDLVVVMLGGNELTVPTLKGDGSKYAPYYAETLTRLRAGAPGAGCLLITPLDQGTREGGAPRSRSTLVALNAAIRTVAQAQGCAVWDAQAAMGGEGAIVRWAALRPSLAWADLVHLSGTGQDIVGQLLSDAILAGYDAWVAGGGPARAPAAAP